MRIIVSLLLPLLLVAAATAQTFCAPFTTVCFASGRATVMASHTLSLSQPFGAVHAPRFIRDPFGPATVAGGIYVRSWAQASAPSAFPFDSSLLLLLDTSSGVVIDMDYMFDPGSHPGVEWAGEPVLVPQGLDGLTILTQGFLIDAAGNWQATNAHQCALVY